MKSDPSGLEDLNGNWRALGACWLVYGLFRIVVGIGLVLFTGTATVMFGALLGRVPNPYALMADFHLVYAALVILSFLCGLVGILAGLALLANQPSARIACARRVFFVGV